MFVGQNVSVGFHTDNDQTNRRAMSMILTISMRIKCYSLSQLLQSAARWWPRTAPFLKGCSGVRCHRSNHQELWLRSSSASCQCRLWLREQKQSRCKHVHFKVKSHVFCLHLKSWFLVTLFFLSCSQLLSGKTVKKKIVCSWSSVGFWAGLKSHILKANCQASLILTLDVRNTCEVHTKLFIHKTKNNLFVFVFGLFFVTVFWKCVSCFLSFHNMQSII